METLIDRAKHYLVYVIFTILVLLVLAGGWRVYRWLFPKQTHELPKLDYSGASIGTQNIDQRSYTSKHLSFFIEPFVGVNTNEDNRADAGVRVGMRFTF